jgi:hypothetical protein
MSPAAAIATRPTAVFPAPSESARTAGALLRTFFSIADRWALSAGEQATLLDTSRATVFRLRRRARRAGGGGPVTGLSTSLVERLAVVWEIFKGLRTFFANNRMYADQWIREPNSHPLFGGRSALDRLLSGRVIDLYLVRDHVAQMLGAASW